MIILGKFGENWTKIVTQEHPPITILHHDLRSGELKIHLVT